MVSTSIAHVDARTQKSAKKKFLSKHDEFVSIRKLKRKGKRGLNRYSITYKSHYPDKAPKRKR